MQESIVPLLCCPDCHGDLSLSMTEMVRDQTETATVFFPEVMMGSLTCGDCGRVYPIEYTIPLLLPQEVLDRRSFGLWPPLASERDGGPPR